MTGGASAPFIHPNIQHGGYIIKKRTGRGGPGRNQGLRKDTYKNAQKPPENRANIQDV